MASLSGHVVFNQTNIPIFKMTTLIYDAFLADRLVYPVFHLDVRRGQVYEIKVDLVRAVIFVHLEDQTLDYVFSSL